ncbi:thermonuclease family protein [Alphaproteobacteria bacterium]|nr:thermonuclease family protein [Alphaproteobacteria bacterium]
MVVVTWIFSILIIFSVSLNVNAKTITGNAKVIDGDTIHIGSSKIRLHGIDAPETDQTCEKKNVTWFCGQESTKALTKFINNQKVICNTKGTDRYKRYISVCFVNNFNMNEFMVENGWAIAYRYYSKDYVESEDKAKKNKVGIWQGSFQEPYFFRKNN